MGLITGANAKVSIGTTAAHGDQTEYEADTYILIEETDVIGEFGDTTAEVSFTGLSDARTRRMKGSANAGTMSLSMGYDVDAGPGQAALIAASEDYSSDDYNFKIEYSDGAVRYLSGQVGTFVEGVPGADEIVRVTSDVRINTPILRVAAP